LDNPYSSRYLLFFLSATPNVVKLFNMNVLRSLRKISQQILKVGEIYMNKLVKNAAAVVLGLTLATGASAQEVLKIGVVSALDGPGSEWGRGVDGGTKIAAKEVNDAGGLKVGDKTYKLQVISYDDAYKAAQGVAAATRLIEQDRVKFILGPLGSASGLAVKPMYEQNKVVGLVNTYTPQ